MINVFFFVAVVQQPFILKINKCFKESEYIVIDTPSVFVVWLFIVSTIRYRSLESTLYTKPHNYSLRT